LLLKPDTIEIYKDLLIQTNQLRPILKLRQNTRARATPVLPVSPKFAFLDKSRQ
jgi:hypothetical protein